MTVLLCIGDLVMHVTMWIFTIVNLGLGGGESRIALPYC